MAASAAQTILRSTSSKAAFINASFPRFLTVSEILSARRNLSTSNFLINDPKYTFLKDLDLTEKNHGVYDGTWHGKGEVTVVKH